MIRGLHVAGTYWDRCLALVFTPSQERAPKAQGRKTLIVRISQLLVVDSVIKLLFFVVMIDGKYQRISETLPSNICFVKSSISNNFFFC